MNEEKYYNCKIVYFGTEMQIRTYDKAMKTGGRKKHHAALKSHELTFEEIENGFSNGEYNFDDITNILANKNFSLERSLTVSSNRSKNKIYEYARSNSWEWFFTWTFNPKKIDPTDYGLVVKKIGQHLNELKRKIAPDLKYLIVPELHDGFKSTVYCSDCGESYLRPRKTCPKCRSKNYKNAFHFHALISNVGRLKLNYSGLNCIGSKKFKSTEESGKGNPIYNIGNYNWGWSTATRIIDSKRASSYLSKYITKELCFSTKGKRRYLSSMNLELPIHENVMLSELEIKKLLQSYKDRTVHNSFVSITAEGYKNKISYYEISLT